MKELIINVEKFRDRGTEYKSVMNKWDSKSAVRSKPRRILADEDQDRLFFSSKLIPSSTHSLILKQGDDQVKEFLTRHLYSYLDFTTILEQEIVNPVVLRLSRDAFGLEIPDDMKFDGYRIYCDEAYHALFSADTKRQVEGYTGLIPSPMVEPTFSRTLREAKESLPNDLGGLVDLCASIVSETLISGSLTTIPTDKNVVSFVRDMIADHAADERTHHAYFTKIFEMAWPQIDRKTQQFLSPYFADFIVAFLTPDIRSQLNSLNQIGFNREEAEQILCESYPDEKLISDTRYSARNTIRLLERAGILTENKVRDRFNQLGLIVD